MFLFGFVAAWYKIIYIYILPILSKITFNGTLLTQNYFPSTLLLQCQWRNPEEYVEMQC